MTIKQWRVRDTLTGAVYPQPNKMIAEKVAEMHGHSEVFEQAHTPSTPSDDEREAWISIHPNGVIADIWSNEEDATTYGIGERVEHVTLRRTVQGEPSDAEVEAAYNAVLLNGAGAYQITRSDMRAALRAAVAVREEGQTPNHEIRRDDHG